MPRRLPFAPVETASYRRLLPDPGDTDATRSCSSLELRNADTARERPYTIVNFVASVDGRATIDGLSRKLSDRGDRELFRSLRERADAVLVGTATLAAENYGRMLPQAERRERRVASGRTAEPLVSDRHQQRPPATRDPAVLRAEARRDRLLPDTARDRARGRNRHPRAAHDRSPRRSTPCGRDHGVRIARSARVGRRCSARSCASGWSTSCS